MNNITLTSGIDESILIRCLAGEWDPILIKLFKEYDKCNMSSEKQRLTRVIMADLVLMRKENIPLPAVELYRDLFNSLLKQNSTEYILN